jgi:hypothetical protein
LDVAGLNNVLRYVVDPKKRCIREFRAGEARSSAAAKWMNGFTALCRLMGLAVSLDKVEALHGRMVKGIGGKLTAESFMTFWGKQTVCEFSV